MFVPREMPCSADFGRLQCRQALSNSEHALQAISKTRIEEKIRLTHRVNASANIGDGPGLFTVHRLSCNLGCWGYTKESARHRKPTTLGSLLLTTRLLNLPTQSSISLHVSLGVIFSWEIPLGRGTSRAEFYGRLRK